MGARTFIQTTKKGDAFFVYAIPTLDPRMQQHEIPIQYKDYKDVFEKKNENKLPEHWPYDCVIDLEKRKHTPFGPIYNLSQNELLALPKYIDKNLEKGFIWHSKFPTNALILFVKKKIWIFTHVCRLLWIKLTHHQKLVPFAHDFKIVGLI